MNKTIFVQNKKHRLLTFFYKGYTIKTYFLVNATYNYTKEYIIVYNE